MAKLFYGFIPLSGPKMVLVRGSMRVITGTQLLSKSLVLGVLKMLGGKSLVAMVMTIEIAVYLLYKVIRRDLRYYPVVKGAMSWVLTLFFRVVVKLVADFTAMIHFRMPLELGGSYWLFTMAYTQVSVFAALGAKSYYGAGEGEEGEIFTQERLILIAVVLSLLWMAAMGVLITCCEKEYRHTFYAKWTGSDYQRLRFEEGDDQTRMKIVTTVHRALWSGFEDQIRHWLESEWGNLHANKPHWFSEDIAKLIPVDLIPNIEEFSPSTRKKRL